MLDYKRRGYRVFFLSRAIESKDFNVELEVTEGFTFENDRFRQMMLFSYATLSDEFPDVAARSHYIAAGVPDSDSIIQDVYEIDPARRDVVAPTTDDPEWKFWVIRDPQLRFTIPAP